MTTTWQKLPENIILVAGLTVLALILLLRDGRDPSTSVSERLDFPAIYLQLESCPSAACRVAQGVLNTADRYLLTLESTSLILKGQSSISDLVQDVAGFRRLVRQQNAYPSVEVAAAELGLYWPIEHASTHPPTAFLLVAPVAFLPWGAAAAAWAWLMLALCALTFRSYGASWKTAIGLTPLALLWQPIALSLGQFTIIWLFAFALAFRIRAGKPFGSGVLIGTAALTKYFPGLMVVSFLLQKQWRALLGFAATWLLAMVTLLLLNPDVIAQYIAVNQSTSPAMIARTDNASLLVNSYRWGGWIGLGLVLALFVLVIWVHRDSFRGTALDESPRHWLLLTYFSVALLPISWMYSLTPLLPLIIWLILRKKLVTMTIGLCCLVIPCVILPYGDFTVFPLALVTLLVGVGLLADGLNLRVFTAVSLKELFHSAS